MLRWSSLGSNELVVGHKERTQQEFKLRQKDESRRLDLLAQMASHCTLTCSRDREQNQI